MTNELTHRELTAGGEDQLPYPVDTGREGTMYEAEDIVEYLDEQFG